MLRRLPVLFVTAFAIVLIGQTCRAAEVKITKITSSDHVGQWAVEEVTGRIFASLPDSDAVVEYDSVTCDSVRKFSVAGGPAHLIVKSHWLVAACPKNSSVGLIDLTTNKVAGKVQLSGKGPVCLFCSKADNTYVYAVCNTGEAWWDGEIFQFDCQQHTLRNHWPLKPGLMMDVQHVCMSADGRWLVADSRGHTTPSGADLVSIDEDAATFKHISHLHDSFGQIVADPTGRWWTLGDKLYPLELSGEASPIITRAASLRTFGGSPVAIHPSYDLAVAVNPTGNALVFQNFSDASDSKTIDLQSGGIAPGDDTVAPGTRPPRARRPTPRGTPGPRAVDPCLAFDLAHDRLIFAADDQAYVLSIADQLASRAKRLAIAGAPSLEVTMDQSRHVRLSIADGGKAVWAIESGPSFAKLNGNELTVAPTAADLGRHEIVVKAAREKLKDTVTIALDVGMPVLDFGFQIHHMAIDSSGKVALVWGRKTAQRVGYDPNAATEPTDFALVDLDAMRVLATQNVKADIQLACLDDKYIYMVLSSGNVLFRIDRTDLSKRNRLFLNGQPSRMEILPGGQIAVKSSNPPFASTLIYDRETLARNPAHFAQSDANVGIEDSPAIGDVGADGTLVFREKIVDAATGETLCALEQNALPALCDAVVRENNIPGRVPRRALWARLLNGQTLASTQGSRIAEFRGIASISPFDPLAVCVRQEQDNRHAKRVLEFHEIKLGEVIRSVDLGETEMNQGGMPFYGGYASSPLQITKDKVVYHDGSRLFACPIPDEVKKKVAFPLALKAPKIPVVSVEKPMEVHFATYSDEDKPTYALAKEYEGLTIDAASGKLTIDLPLIWKKYLSGKRPPDPYGRAIAMPEQQPDTRAIFQRLTGTPLAAGKTAFRLPLRVAVTNNAGESDELRLSAIVVAPRADVERIAARQQAELAAQQAKAREEMLRQQQEQARLAAARMGQPAGADGDRITQLENRVRRLEASLDAVLQKLDRLEQSNGGEKRDQPARK